MLEKQRQRMIVDILADREFVKVIDLAAELNASEATIRRDINRMAAENQIKKIRGGAQSIKSRQRPSLEHSLQGASFEASKEQNSRAKRLIAKKAVELCADGEAIIVNGGSSTYMMGEFLVRRRVNILTNSIFLAQFLWESSDLQISLPGGEIYREQGIILSSYENDGAQNYFCSKMFMGTPGIGMDGVMEADPLLIRSEEKLRRQAEKLIVLADSSKLGKTSNFLFAPLSEVDVLITDNHADPEIVRKIEQAGVEVVIANLD